MSKYTTEVRFICETEYGLTSSVGYSQVDTILNAVAPKVFNFDFPIFDESYRLTLETKILKHFYTREIGLETVGLWKLFLNKKLNEIMPYYNKLYKSELLDFNPLYTHNLTRTHDISGTRADTLNSSNSNKVESTNTTNGNTTNWNLYSDTPQGGLEGITSETYLTNATKNTNTDAVNETGSTTQTESGTNTSNGNTTEHYLETVVGYEGKDASEMLLKYRKTFLNIDMMIINDLEDLFMQLW